jgi:hypothetical protein
MRVGRAQDEQPKKNQSGAVLLKMGYLDESTVHEETSSDIVFVSGAAAAIPHKSSPLGGFCEGIACTQLVP